MKSGLVTLIVFLPVQVASQQTGSQEHNTLFAGSASGSKTVVTNAPDDHIGLTAESRLSEAISLYVAVPNAPESVQLQHYSKIWTMLEGITLDFPDSDIALKILLGDSVGGLDISAFETFLNDPGTKKPPAIDLSREKPTVKSDETVPQPSATTEPVGIEETEKLLGLSKADKREIQQRLLLLGFSPKGVDGIFGPGTRGAISTWQTAVERNATGYLDQTQLNVLRHQSETKYQDWKKTAPKHIAKQKNKSNLRSKSQVIKGVRWTYRGGIYPYCKPCGQDYQCRAEKRKELCQMYPPYGWRK